MTTPFVASTPPRPLNERIVWARKRKGISQERLAGMIGTSRRHMIRIEKGTQPGPVFIARIAEATDQPESFFTAEGEDDEEEADLESALTHAIRALVRAEVRETRVPTA